MEDLQLQITELLELLLSLTLNYLKSTGDKFINCVLLIRNSLKKILVIFRDFTPEDENFEVLSKTVKDDILKLWQEIKKPKEL